MQMVYNFIKMSAQKLVSIFLLIALLTSNLFVFPISKVEAQVAVTDLAHTAVTAGEATRRTTKDILNAAAMFTAQIVIERIVASTVEWANSGFEGNPAYVTDPKQYFTNIADGAAGDFIKGSDLGFLCSPFQANIRLSLAQQYYQPRPFQCTITQIVGNIDNFLGDFNQGGWDAWFSMTQNPTNNPYGAYLEAKIELDSRIASALGLEKEQLEWNQGFLSWADCIVKDPLTGECLARGPVKTPGTIIKGQLDRVLPSGLEKLISVENVEQLAQSFAAGLLQRYVFGSKGLFSNDTKYEYDPTLPPPGTPVCPIPTTPKSLCENVDREIVLTILNKYRPSNAGITAAIIEVQEIYPQAKVIPHARLDKIDFGGGLVVDVIIGAVGGTAEGSGWGWIVDCDCGGPIIPNPGSNPLPEQ